MQANLVHTVVNYSASGRIEQEAPHEIQSTKPSPQWPSKGAIEFKDVSMSYRPGLPNVLHSISLSIKAGEKIGIVGRTGMKGELSRITFERRLNRSWKIFAYFGPATNRRIRGFDHHR